jgi:hypothetical protein
LAEGISKLCNYWQTWSRFELAVWHKNAQPLNKKIEHTTENAAFVDNREENNNSTPFVFTLPADPAVQIQTADEYLEGQK